MIPLFTTTNNIQNSILTQAGTTAISVGGSLNLPAARVATATKGSNSQPQDFVASSFSSTTKTAVPETFQWQAEPVGNNTAAPNRQGAEAILTAEEKSQCGRSCFAVRPSRCSSALATHWATREDSSRSPLSNSLRFSLSFHRARLFWQEERDSSQYSRF